MRWRLGLHDSWSRYWASLRQERLRHLEEFTLAHPRLGTAVAVGVCVLGYAYLFLWPVVSALLVIDLLGRFSVTRQTGNWGLFVFELVALAITGWISVRFAQLTPGQPEGLPVPASKAIRLINEIERHRRSFGSPPIHDILITPRFELEVIRVPSSMYPLRTRNVLLIGLPLVQSSSPGQLSTALGRKLGQLARTYLRPSGWVYFANGSFQCYRDITCSRWRPERVVLRMFYSWFTPAFDVLSFFVRRLDELRADRIALDSANIRSLADTLATQAVMRRFLENEFWPKYLKLSTRYPRPPFPPYGALARRVLKGIDARQLEPWLTKELSADAGYHDTQPALRERLQIISEDAVDPVASTDGLAGPDYLGEFYLEAVGDIDEQWIEQNAAEWSARYNRNERIRRRFQLLLRQASEGVIPERDAWEYTLLLPRYFEGDALVERLRELLASDPKDARVWFYIGRFLLQRKESDGVKALETAMTLDEEHTVAACRLITRYMVDTGAKKYAQFYRRKALAYQAQAA